MSLDSVRIFGDGDLHLESVVLKNPNQYREAVLFEIVTNLPKSKQKEFINSPEAKAMLEDGIITRDFLERVAAEHDGGCLKTTVCHMAKENGDPLWDELIAARMTERRLMNELLAKYGTDAKTIVENANDEIIEMSIPEYFRK